MMLVPVWTGPDGRAPPSLGLMVCAVAEAMAIASAKSVKKLILGMVRSFGALFSDGWAQRAEA